MSKVCVMLVGLPGSGKTTFRKTLLAYHTAKAQEAFPAWCCLSTDDLVEVAAKERGLSYSEAWEGYIKEAERIMFGQLKFAVDYGDQVIVVDRTNLTLQSRKRIFEAIRERDPSFKFIAFEFHCRTAEWSKRLLDRPGKEIPQDVITRMQADYRKPALDEGFEYIQHIDTTRGLPHIQSIYNVILNITEDKAPHNPR